MTNIEKYNDAFVEVFGVDSAVLNDSFSKDEVLITKLLADQGYTCGLTGKLHLTAAEGRMEKREGK